MKITTISDTHFRHQYINTQDFTDTDILIHAGDFTGNGSEYQVSTFLKWYSAISVPTKILVAGNHDTYCTNPKFKELLKKYPTITYLENSSTTVNDLKIWGSPYSNIFGHWFFMLDDFELDPIWSKIPKDVDILITHGPSYGVADKVLNTFSSDSHVGSKTLTDTVNTLKNLKVHISGHIHEAYGIYPGKHLTICPSICDLNYVPFNRPISFYLGGTNEY